MTLFQVYGPYVIPAYRGSAGRVVTTEDGVEFFKQHPTFKPKVGCYIFAMRSRSITPIYMGKTARTFGQETFGPYQLGKYNKCLADYKRGTPVMFFVVLPNRRGPRNKKHVDELETFLIQTGVGVNPELLNVHGTKAEEWGIAGILRSGRGRRSDPAVNFKRMLKL